MSQKEKFSLSTTAVLVFAAVVVLAAGGIAIWQKGVSRKPPSLPKPLLKPRLIPAKTASPSPTPKSRIKCPPGQEPVYKGGVFIRCQVSVSPTATPSSRRSPKPKPTPTPKPSAPNLEISENWLACQQDSDCVLARNPCGGCPVGINQNYQTNLEQTECASPDPVVDSTTGSRCTWSLLKCPGSPVALCLNNVCVARPCGVPPDD